MYLWRVACKVDAIERITYEYTSSIDQKWDQLCVWDGFYLADEYQYTRAHDMLRAYAYAYNHWICLRWIQSKQLVRIHASVG